MEQKRKWQSARITRAEILNAAVRLFLEQGYQNTTVAQITGQVGKSTAAFFRAYPDKEAVLCAFVPRLFDFDRMERALESGAEPLLVYGMESALRLQMAEMREPFRDLFVSAYSLPSTAEAVCRGMAPRLMGIFSLPGGAEKDFYEREIAVGGMMRGYLARACDLYFTLERKIQLYLECSLKLYDVPEKKRRQTIERVLAAEREALARQAMEDMTRSAWEEPGDGQDSR